MVMIYPRVARRPRLVSRPLIFFHISQLIRNLLEMSAGGYILWLLYSPSEPSVLLSRAKFLDPLSERSGLWPEEKSTWRNAGSTRYAVRILRINGSVTLKGHIVFLECRELESCKLPANQKRKSHTWFEYVAALRHLFSRRPLRWLHRCKLLSRGWLSLTSFQRLNLKVIWLVYRPTFIINSDK